MARPTTWTDDKVAYLLDNYQQLKYKELAEHLGTTPNRVKRKLRYMKKEKSFVKKEWTDEELEQLRHDVEFNTPAYLAKKYDCMYSEITAKIRLFQRKKDAQDSKPIARPEARYTNPDYSSLIEKYASMSI